MRHSLVVGGTRGIGRVVASHLQARGDRVSVVGRKPDAVGLEDLAFFPQDIEDAGGIADLLTRIVDEGGPLSCVVFCQRFRGEGDDLNGEFQRSVVATERIIRLLPPHMADEGASVIGVGSAAAQFVVDEQPVGYHAGKAALRQLFRHAAVTLGPAGIRVNTVSPGLVVKPESGAHYEDERYQRTIAATPLGRLAQASDVAEVICFLASSAASFVTGQDLVLDGGLSLRGHDSLLREIAYED